MGKLQNPPSYPSYAIGSSVRRHHLMFHSVAHRHNVQASLTLLKFNAL